MTENIITVALIAIATIGIISLYGDNVRGLFAASSDSLAGANSVKNPGDAKARFKAELTQKTLATFAGTNASGGVSGGGGVGRNGASR